MLLVYYAQRKEDGGYSTKSKIYNSIDYNGVKGVYISEDSQSSLYFFSVMRDGVKLFFETPLDYIQSCNVCTAGQKEFLDSHPVQLWKQRVR